MAEAAAAAFMDEELYGVLMHPHRKEYPEDYALAFERMLLTAWYSANRKFLVGLDKTSGNVVAFAEWERQGISATSTSWKIVMNKVVPYYVQASSCIWPNRAADPTKSNVLEDSFPFFAHHWSGPRKQNWCLQKLATHPAFQGQGLGGELVQWGLDAADQENICASVVSADGRESFYGKFGFVEVGRANVGPLKENGVQGGGSHVS